MFGESEKNNSIHQTLKAVAESLEMLPRRLMGG